ncbi:MAG: RagB/SusD family nutrient uptake outer membrane protein, partial [Prevotellaceae bacterium]|nr:RagB/SusD family nutrient uptake outer membrane protein [Prevotellaceae bacterium]
LGGNYTPGPMATDEAFTLFATGTYRGMGFVLGEMDAENSAFSSYWKLYYQIIRQCNVIFSRIDEAPDWTMAERQKILAYNRFIRAYAYYNLVMNWGPVVLMGDLIELNNEEMTHYDRPRDLYDTCINYICAEFEEASKNLPAKATSIMDYGLPTKGAALALVARLRLIHASPLYNGGTAARMYFGAWTRKTDGKHYISQTYDAKRWAVAAAAAKRVIDFQIDGLPAYGLHTVIADDNTPQFRGKVDDPNYGKPFPNGSVGIDHLRSYSEMFNSETVPYVNPEFIWARTSSSLRNYACIQAFPFMNEGGNGMCVTQKIVDAYEMRDGRPITAYSLEYPYQEEGFTSTMQTFSGYRLNSGVSNMYVNREMRFYASIGFNECFWPNLSTTDGKHRNTTAYYTSDGPDGRSSVTNPANHPITGYVIKKFINPIDCTAGSGARILDKTFPIIRYAEILLSYAEALNALTGASFAIETDGISHTYFRDKNEIKNAFNQVRYRAGLPGLTDTELDDADCVLEKIKKERMIEFLYENRRYFDVRRWGDYEDSENEPIMGMNTAASRDSYYQRVVPASSRIGGRVINRRRVYDKNPFSPCFFEIFNNKDYKPVFITFITSSKISNLISPFDRPSLTG